jgi:hypothetical protein
MDRVHEPDFPCRDIGPQEEAEAWCRGGGDQRGRKLRRRGPVMQGSSPGSGVAGARPGTAAMWGREVERLGRERYWGVLGSLDWRRVASNDTRPGLLGGERQSAAPGRGVIGHFCYRRLFSYSLVAKVADSSYPGQLLAHHWTYRWKGRSRSGDRQVARWELRRRSSVAPAPRGSVPSHLRRSAVESCRPHRLVQRHPR